MRIEDDRRQICWDEFSTGEALTLLRRLAADAGGKAVSGFLDTHQWVSLPSEPGIRLDGGHSCAQFRRAALGLKSVPLAINQCPASNLPAGLHTARQLRGWLYRQGAPDGSLGDIVVTDQVLAVTDPQLDLSACGLDTEQLDSWPNPQSELKRTTAAAPRADAVAAAVFAVSRGEAQTAIKHGFLFADFQPVDKRTQTLAAGQQLIFRTRGRAELVGIELNPRSGRVWVEYRLYPC